jgi:alkanesulfonate monooxygenase SsuD/methylene tetrahydromethanopterin reductase-like flavin-dependent oxidoreductase (luciferase family)
MIGGGGRRVLEFAAREADIVSLAPRQLRGVRGDPGSITWAATEEKIGWLREAAGDRFDQLELNIYPSQSPIIITDHARAEVEDLARRLEQRSGVPITPDELLESPHIFVGSLDSLAEKLIGIRERLGISSFMVGEPHELEALVERLAGT